MQIMVGIGILGVGGWGQNHARVLAELQSEDLIERTIVIDIDEIRAKKISKKFGLEFSTNYEDVLKREDIHGIIIATPTPLHYMHTKKALEAGKHVLVEKPVTETSLQAKELKKLSEKNKLIVMAGFLLRYSPAIEKVKEIVKQNIMGNILTIIAKRTSWWPKRKLDVGVVRDLAIHDIDLIRYLFGLNPRVIFAYGGKIIHDYEDFVSASILYSDEASEREIMAHIEANWVTPFKIRRMEITTEKGLITIDFMMHTIEIMNEDGIRIPKIPYQEPLKLEDINFIEAIKGKVKPKVNINDGILALETCERILDAINTKQPVKI